MKNYTSILISGLVSLVTVGIASCASIASAETVPPHKSSPFETQLKTILSDVASDWNAGAYDNLANHWDTADPNPIYLAEESDVIMTNWEEVNAYWTASQKWIEWIIVDYSNFKVKRVDPTNAMVAFDLRFDLKLNDRPRPIGGDNRAVVSFRYVNGKWKIHSWVEAPLSAITYVRKLYELNVSDDLPRR